MIQLKLKTEFSFGETFAPVEKVISRLVEMGCTAAGIVDNSTWGHVEWYNSCTAAGIQPLLGVECVVADDDNIPLKMWFLARNTEGLKEMYRAMSKAHQQPIKTKRGSVCRLYRHDVLNMTENIFKFAGDITDASFLKEAEAILDLSPASQILNAKKKSLYNNDNGFWLVSTSDNSFVYEDDRGTFEICSKSSLKPTPMHILDDLPKPHVELMVSHSCKNLILPKAPMVSEDGDLEELCLKGAVDRFDPKNCPKCHFYGSYRRVGNGGASDTDYWLCECGYEWSINWTEKYTNRLEYELDLIRSKNFESYFIIVADMVRYAKQHMLVGPSRGSAAGSLVCYLLGITEIDPIPAGLYFERFIDVNRSDLPDIDLDFPDNKRQMVFDYMAEKYGANNTAHIGTISRFRPLSALNHVCRVLRMEFSESDPVKAVLLDKTLKETLLETPVGRSFTSKFPAAKAAGQIEGHASHTGTHAAGLLVCDDDITNYCTVDAKGIAHVEKGAAEQLGLLKIDVLGLRTLSILEDSGVDVDWYNLSLDDPETLRVFNEGRLCSVFQFDGAALRRLSRDIHFESINDINIVTALARPGPLGAGLDKRFIARKAGNDFESILPSLDETYGLPIYQEQSMSIVREIGGFNWEETTDFRKAVAKSKGVEEFREKFIAGANREDAEKIWNMISEMGSYQMNKAHTYSYAVISYWTAYLKAHHPLEFAAANLRHAKDDESAINLLREMDSEGIKYVPFDLEKSDINWSVQEGVLYGGFTALHGIGQVKARKYVSSRESLTEKQQEFIEAADNPFDDIFPFHKNYQYLYDNPSENGVATEISEICDINKDEDVPHGEERVFLAELTYKKLRNMNEEVNIKKRNGIICDGPLEYVNIRLRDDHGDIGGRIGVRDFGSIGSDLLENVPVGTHLLIRAAFYNGIPWAFVKKWRRLDET